MWDRWILEGDLTVQQVLDWFKVSLYPVHMACSNTALSVRQRLCCMLELAGTRLPGGVPNRQPKPACGVYNLFSEAGMHPEAATGLIEGGSGDLQKRNLEAYSISCGQSLLYNNIFPKHKERLSKPMSGLVKSVAKMDIPAKRNHFDVVVACEDEEGEDLDVPLVSIKFR